LDYTWKTIGKRYFQAGHSYDKLRMDYISCEKLDFPIPCICFIEKNIMQAMTKTTIIQYEPDGTVVTVPG